MGVVQLESAGALDVAALVLDEGEGVANGTSTAGATGTAASTAAGAAGLGTVWALTGSRAAAGAAGFGLAGTGAGAGAGAGGPAVAGAETGGDAGAGASGDVVSAGAGVLGAGETGEGEVGQFSGRQVVACTGPAAETEATSASTEAANPGSTSVRRLVGRIMWLPLLDAQGSPAAGLSRVSSYALPLITKSLTAGFPGAARCAGICRLRRQLPRAAGAVLAAPATWAAAEAAGCPHPQARQAPFPPWWTGHPR